MRVSAMPSPPFPSTISRPRRAVIASAAIESGPRAPAHAGGPPVTISRRRALALACVLVALLPAARAAAGWTSLGAMPAPRREGPGLVFKNGQGTVALTALTPSVVRVRFAPGESLGRDHSWAIL